MIRVMLADDQKILRDGLRALLQSDEMTVVGEASNGKEAVGMSLTLKPDVILMDIRMPEMDGVEATRRIRGVQPKTAVIMLTTFDDDEYVIKAMTYGASGYLLKDIDSAKLKNAIRDCINGSIILPGRIAAKITSHLSDMSGSGAQADDFTEREIHIIRLLTVGRSNAEIAGTLYLSTGTVKNYISQIYQKLGVGDRANAVIALKRLGF